MKITRAQIRLIQVTLIEASRDPRFKLSAKQKQDYDILIDLMTLILANIEDELYIA